MTRTLSRTEMSSKQKQLFALIERCGEMVLGIGQPGAYANLVGSISVRTHSDHQRQEDLIIDCDDGTCHVHVDWSRVRSARLSDHHGEGRLSFFDGDICLFDLYKIGGDFPEEIENLVGILI